MKKSSIFAGALIGALALLSFSCESLDGIIQTPSAEIKSVSLASLDLEGIKFNCNYEVKNPYGVSLSLKGISVDVECKDSKVTTISTENGLNIGAQKTTSNTMSFNVPYDSIMNLSKAYNSSKTLPFGLDGKITIDTSGVTALQVLGQDSITISLSKDFEVPVFKPNLSVGNFKVKMPTLNDLKDQLVNGGLGVTKALQVANALISGNGLSLSLLDGIDMDIDFTFDLNVANEGGADWLFKIKDCSLITESGKLANVGPSGSNQVSSNNGKVEMKTSLNTIQAGAFIVQLLNKSGKNPTFNLESSLTLPETSFAKDIPLKYSAEIPLNDVKR